MKHISTLLALSVLAVPFTASAISYTGFVTPSELTYHFSSVQAISDSGSYISLVTDAFSATFKRTDADFAGVELKDISMPFGRYKGVQICQTSEVQVKLNGNTFDGPSGSLLSHGATLYTVKTDNSTGTIATSAGSGAVTATISNSAGCYSTYLTTPICVTDDSQVECQAGDQVYTASGRVANSKDSTTPPSGITTLQIYLMVDLYDSVAIDSGTGQIAAAPNVAIVAGKPGAAIHLGKSSSSGTANASLLFGPDKKLLTVVVGQYPGGSSGYIPEICSGQNNPYVTGGPSDAPIKTGIVPVGAFDITANSGKGKIQSAAVGSCMDESNCLSQGMNVFQNFLQAVGNQATGLCIADSAATPPYLGYTYPSGSGYTGGNPAQNLDIIRIVDPTNLFGICTASYVTGHTGSCSSVNAGTDGYN
jgi:hypothetical protein